MLADLLLAEAHDYRPGIPDAPVEMQVDLAQQAIFTAICGIPTALAIAIAVRAIVKHRNHIWALFLLGGAFAMMVEPIFDYMGGVWWPVNGWEAFNLLGVNIPWLVPLVYPWLIGGNSYVAYRLLERGITPRYLWALVALFAAEDVVLETIGVTVLDVYAYFGQQPLNPWGLPLWYVACNAPGFMMPGVLCYLFRHHLRGLRGGITTVALFPMGYLGTYALIGFPCWIALNSGWGFWAAQACGLVSFVLAYLVIQGVAALACTPDQEAAADFTRESPLALMRRVVVDRYSGFRRPADQPTREKVG